MHPGSAGGGRGCTVAHISHCTCSARRDQKQSEAISSELKQAQAISLHLLGAAPGGGGVVGRVEVSARRAAPPASRLEQAVLEMRALDARPHLPHVAHLGGSDRTHPEALRSTQAHSGALRRTAIRGPTEGHPRA